MANSVDPDQAAPIGAVCSVSMLFASILNLSVMLGNYLQQTTFSAAFFSLCIYRLEQEATRHRPHNNQLTAMIKVLMDRQGSSNSRQHRDMVKLLKVGLFSSPLPPLKTWSILQYF